MLKSQIRRTAKNVKQLGKLKKQIILKINSIDKDIINKLEPQLRKKSSSLGETKKANVNHQELMD